MPHIRIALLLVALSLTACPAQGQRSLFHRQRDLEFRISSYMSQKRILDDILATSIDAIKNLASGQTSILPGNNVRFSDLIVPRGFIQLESHVARTAIKVMVNKSQGFVDSKMNELLQIQGQLYDIKRQLNQPRQRFIHKGKGLAPGMTPQRVYGNRLFKQFAYSYSLDSEQVFLKHINLTDVDRVLNETYMETKGSLLEDSKRRLFFEGTKTFYRTVFANQLNSGCCDRLRPLHTSRMMTRSTPQEVMSPVMFQTNDRFKTEPVVIRRLSTGRLQNSILTVGMLSNRPDAINLIKSPPENVIQLYNLINIRQTTNTEVAKTLVFANNLMVEDAHLSYTPNIMRPSIGVASVPGLHLDLVPDNYLLKFADGPGNITLTQRVSGRVFMNSQVNIQNGISANEVNGRPDFTRFVTDNIVRIDRPATIQSPVQFNALPVMFSPNDPSRPPHSIEIIRVSRGDLEVALINGMRFPIDIFLIPPPPGLAMPLPYLRVRGPRNFVGQAIFEDSLKVDGHVNGLQIPENLIPLHLNDSISGPVMDNLLFVEGIRAHHVDIHSGRFDEITLRDLNGDAQSVILRSVISTLPDGVQIIRAPLQIRELRLQKNRITGQGGHLNGFRPESIIDLQRHKADRLRGKKTFQAHVEAAECIFTDINRLANWTSHLIRIDRPNTVQTVHTKLAFVRDSMGKSSVDIERLNVDFMPSNHPLLYLHNLNFSPELFSLHHALVRAMSNDTGGRYRVLGQINLMNPARSLVNGIHLDNIVTLDKPFRFADRFVIVGKVEIMNSLRAGRIHSNYPIDSLDLVQFEKYRIPISGSRTPIRLNNLVLAGNNQASFAQIHLLNGTPFNEFVSSIMSLTRPQTIESSLMFMSPVNMEGMLRTRSSLNGIQNFSQFASRLKKARYVFEDGLQCDSVYVRGS